MARQRVYVDGEDRPSDPQAIAFAKRLKKFMVQKGWRQAELARRADAFMPPGQTFGRHLVSSYIRGLHLPSQISLEAMARALEVKPTDLVTEGIAVVVGVTDRAVQFSMGTNGMSRLKFDIELPNDIALQIMTLVNSHRKATGD